MSFLVPTIGRETLGTTLASIECWPGDEILLISDGIRVDDARVRYIDCTPGNDWGHTERNIAMPQARGHYLAHLDDDDVYVPGHRAVMQDAIEQTPGVPVLFRMQYPNGRVLWKEPMVRVGNVGTPMIVTPNQPTMLGTWGSFIGGDCNFLKTMRWHLSSIVWRPEVVALLGHN